MLGQLCELPQRGVDRVRTLGRLRGIEPLPAPARAPGHRFDHLVDQPAQNEVRLLALTRADAAPAQTLVELAQQADHSDPQLRQVADLRRRAQLRHQRKQRIGLRDQRVGARCGTRVGPPG